MTRFWITLDQGVEFVCRCIERMVGGEVFVPKIPSMRMLDLAKAIAPECTVKFIGIRPGEKLHEVLVSEDEARHAVETDSMFVIRPSFPWWKSGNWPDGKPLPNGFFYTSDSNSDWLTAEEFWSLIDAQSKTRLSAVGH
jgi:UDP-N-acetylglucosamine 4,6-dehydratase